MAYTGTSLSTVFNSFMAGIKDYKLITLFQTSLYDFETYLEGFLRLAIDDFSDTCDQSLRFESGVLADGVFTSGNFEETLTDRNISVIGLIMKRYWLEREIADVLQMNLHVSDKDFKTYSEAQNLAEKRNLLILTKEDISQRMTNYQLKTTDWSEWFSGLFYTP